MTAAFAGVAIVVVFLGFAGLMIARILPALLAVPLLALAIAAIAGVPPTGLATITTSGVIALAGAYTTVIFGALLGRVVMQTGIAETIVQYAAEFGGERPLVLALLLCAAVALLFTSMTGLGAIIMIGTIVLPVMMTSGVPRTTAATLFLLSFALGFILNIAQWKFYRDLFGVDAAPMQHFAYVLFAIQVVVLIGYALIRARLTRDYATWAVAAPAAVPRRRAKPWALIAPILPLVLYGAFHLEALVAFALAAIYAALIDDPREAHKTLVAAWIRGLEDVAPAVILFMGIGMLLASAKEPHVAAALAPIVSAVAPRSPLAYIVLFGLLSPLALYRGPLNPFGVGIGVYAILATLHVLPAVALVAAVMAVVQVQNVCDPTNTQNVWVANFTGVSVERLLRLMLPYQVVVATAATFAVVFFGAQLFPGVRSFSLASPVSAQDAPAGLYSPESTAMTVAVADDGTAAGRIAADEVARFITRSWQDFHALRIDEDPARTDCAHKRYSSMLRVEVGYDDVGLSLVDCAGWSVDEWHVSPAGTTTFAVRQSALGALFRVRTWYVAVMPLAYEVFDRGLAYDVSDPKPTYFYTLFKSDDGNLRALVRPGGPAWEAGMRSNDIVEKIDGRFWWEYGTYQSELRAYDGKPHTFDVQRAGASLHVALGAPFELPKSPL